eukprot:gene13920-18668_t
MKVKENLINYFESKGFKAVDIPKAIIIHECLGIAMLIVTWTTFHKFPIASHQMFKAPLAYIKEKVPSTFSNNPIVNSKYGRSYIEASCFRKLIRPFTLPGKMLLTFHIISQLYKTEKVGGSSLKLDISDSTIKPVMFRTIMKDKFESIGMILNSKIQNEIGKDLYFESLSLCI